MVTRRRSPDGAFCQMKRHGHRTRRRGNRQLRLLPALLPALLGGGGLAAFSTAVGEKHQELSAANQSLTRTNDEMKTAREQEQKAPMFKDGAVVGFCF